MTGSADLARRWFEEVWNQRRDGTVGELMASVCDGHMEGLDVRGPADFLAARAALLATFPDIAVKVEDVIAEGDKAAVRWSAIGTHRGGELGIPASGRKASFRGMSWMRFANGQIVEGWDSWNLGRLMEELRSASVAAASSVAASALLR
jgi:steroid delta-isomerase-like uncharacterized protein